jgi:hypothetical protein
VTGDLSSSEPLGLCIGEIKLAYSLALIREGDPNRAPLPSGITGRTAIFVTFDEGSSGNHVVTIVIAPPVHAGAQSGTGYTHYSLLRTTEELLGLGLLGNAKTATSTRPGFGL